jgi:hypothetical protein
MEEIMKATLLCALLAVLPPSQQPGQQTTRDSGTQARGNQASANGVGMLDGTWQVVYAEKNGQKMDLGKATATIREGVLTLKHDGKEKVMQLRFGPQQMVWAVDISEQGEHERGNATAGKGGAVQPGTAPGGLAQRRAAYQGGVAANTHRGVYIASQEFLCLGLEGNQVPGGPNNRTGVSGAANRGGIAQPAQPNAPGAGQAGAPSTGAAPAAGQSQDRNDSGAPGQPRTGQTGAGIGAPGHQNINARGPHMAQGQFSQAEFVLILHRGETDRNSSER